MNARKNLLAAVSFNDAVNAGSTPEELVDAYRAEVLGEAAKVDEMTVARCPRVSACPSCLVRLETAQRIFALAGLFKRLGPPAADQATAPVCTYCKGDKADPEDPGDYDSAVHMHNPGTRGPCPRCNGTGIDPEDSHPGYGPNDYSMGEPPALEPCRNCGPGGAAST